MTESKKSTVQGFLTDTGDLCIVIPRLEEPHLTQSGNLTTFQLPGRWCEVENGGECVTVTHNGVNMPIGVSAIGICRAPKERKAKDLTKADLTAILEAQAKAQGTTLADMVAKLG